MCKKFYLFSFILFFVLAGYALAQDAEIPPAGAPVPVIDGIREDVWSASEEHEIIKLDADNAPDSDADCYGIWWALWDSDYLYVFVDVDDESLQNDSGESWQDDSIEIYIDAGNDKPTSYLSTGDEYQYRAAWNTEVPEFQEYHHGNRSVPGVEFMVTETDNGYTLEVKFPWEALYIDGKPGLGDLMGFEVMINDDDDGGGRDTQLSWFSSGNNAWNNPSVFGTVEFVADLKASNPTPHHGATGVKSTLLEWMEGRNAVSYDVYFGTNETPGANEFMQNQTGTQYSVASLEPATTYYWRIDVVEAGTVRTGDVWSFTSAPLTAYNPDPYDGARWINLDTTLTWSAGMTAQTHDVYLGTDEDAVANADYSSDEYQGNQEQTAFDPGLLQAKTTYYWRIDEIESDGVTKHKGDLWRFTALGAGAGIKGEYFNNVDLTGEPVLVRIDDVINFDWGLESPDSLLEINNFSVRWTAEVEVPYADTYTFITNIFLSDGIRLWVNGRLLIDHWDGQEPWERKATIDLPAGQASIKVEYFDSDHRAVARLSWESPSIPREVIPKGLYSLPVRALDASPTIGDDEVVTTPVLQWTPGDAAVKHDVYFGIDYNDVADADITTPGIYRGRQDLDNTTYSPPEAPLQWNYTYYWRIDENLADGSINKGNIWYFTTGNFVVIDDFENYDDYPPDEVWNTWIDGYENPLNGSSAGYPNPDFNADGHYLEDTIVRSGFWSLPLFYDNSTARLSEVTSTFGSSMRNWTANDVVTLTLFYRGDPNNVPEPVFVAVGNAVVTNDDANAALVTEWTQWDIPLADIAAQGVNLSNVGSLSIGLGNKSNPVAGGSGVLYIDDIRLYRP